MKIFDCITFYQENFITNIRFEILNEYVDYFIICESKFNHIGEKKNLNFKLLNEKFKKKIIYLIYETPFPQSNNPWENQALQREYIFNNLNLQILMIIFYFLIQMKFQILKTSKNLYLKKNMEFFYKSLSVINLIYIISLKLHGKVLEYVKKKILNLLII